MENVEEKENFKNGKKPLCFLLKQYVRRIKKSVKSFHLQMFKIKFYLNWIQNSLFALLSHCCFTGAFLSRQDPALSVQITSVPTSSPAAFLCTSVVIPSHLWLAVCLHIRISVAPVLEVSKGSLPCSDHFATFVYSTVCIFCARLRIFKNILLWGLLFLKCYRRFLR